MKDLIYIFIIVFFPLFCLGNDQPRQLFEEGNEYYAKGQYKNGVAAYQKF